MVKAKDLPRELVPRRITPFSVLATVGVFFGVASGLALTRVMQSLLFGVKPWDPLMFAVTAVLLALVALLACYIPARRASRVDPLVALRHE